MLKEKKKIEDTSSSRHSRQGLTTFSCPVNRNFCTLRSSGGRGEKSVAGGVSRTARLQYLPRSPAVASHASVTMLTTLCFLLPRTSKPATSSGCWSFCCCRNSQHPGRRNVRRLAAAATAQNAPLSPSYVECQEIAVKRRSASCENRREMYWKEDSTE